MALNWSKIFQNWTWHNGSSVKDTPLNATNLNKINNAIDTLDDRMVSVGTAINNIHTELDGKVDLDGDNEGFIRLNDGSTGASTKLYPGGLLTKDFDMEEPDPIDFEMSSTGKMTIEGGGGVELEASGGNMSFIATLINFFTNSLNIFKTGENKGYIGLILSSFGSSIVLKKQDPSDTMTPVSISANALSQYYGTAQTPYNIQMGEYGSGSSKILFSSAGYMWADELMTRKLSAYQSDNIKVTGNLLDGIEAFSPNEDYPVGRVVTYEYVTYKCTVKHLAGAWNSAHFERLYNSMASAGDMIAAGNMQGGVFVTTKDGYGRYVKIEPDKAYFYTGSQEMEPGGPYLAVPYEIHMRREGSNDDLYINGAGTIEASNYVKTFEFKSNGRITMERTSTPGFEAHLRVDDTNGPYLDIGKSSDYKQVKISSNFLSQYMGDVYNEYCIQMGCYSEAADNIKITSNGKIKASSDIECGGVLKVSGADYAERFETLEDCPIGRFVTLKGEKIKLAQNGDFILGVTSDNPAIIGDKDNIGIPVGVIGKLVVEDDGTAQVDGFVVCGKDGIATAGTGYDCYRVMSRLDENHIRIWVK